MPPLQGTTYPSLAVKTFAKVVAGLAAAAVLLLVASYFWTNHEYTECFAAYKTKDAADRAADAGGDVGFDASVERRTGWVVVFSFGETGGDAQDDRAKFGDILKESNGVSGHPGDGCLERGPFL
jgi:hypothetical protein